MSGFIHFLLLPADAFYRAFVLSEHAGQFIFNFGCGLVFLVAELFVISVLVYPLYFLFAKSKA